MYNTIPELLQYIEKHALITQVNDENRELDDIDLEDTGDAATARIITAITDADAEIDSYLSSRYPMPLPSTPSIVKQLSRDIAIYNLYKRRNREDIPESISEIYKMSLKMLEKIQAGKMNLGIEVTGESDAAAEMLVNKTDDDRIFPKERLDRF